MVLWYLFDLFFALRNQKRKPQYHQRHSDVSDFLSFLANQCLFFPDFPRGQFLLNDLVRSVSLIQVFVLLHIRTRNILKETLWKILKYTVDPILMLAAYPLILSKPFMLLEYFCTWLSKTWLQNSNGILGRTSAEQNDIKWHLKPKVSCVCIRWFNAQQVRGNFLQKNTFK